MPNDIFDSYKQKKRLLAVLLALKENRPIPPDADLGEDDEDGDGEPESPEAPEPGKDLIQNHIEDLSKQRDRDFLLRKKIQDRILK